MSALAFESQPVGKVLYNLWRRGATRTDIEAFGEAIYALERAVDGAVSIFLVIPENTSLPDDGARKLTGEVIKRAKLERVMIVVEGRGFGAGAMRSVFASLGLIYKPGFRWTVKGSVEQGIEWFEREAGGAAIDAAGIRAADRQLREAMDIAPPKPSSSGLFRRSG